MHKEYKATYLYILKAVMFVAAMLMAFFLFNFALMTFSMPVWVFAIVNIVFGLFTIIFLFMLFTSKKPGFVFNEKGFKYKRKKIN